MTLNVKGNFKPSNIRKNLLTISLLFILTLSCLTSYPLAVQGIERTAGENSVAHVTNEAGLRNAVSNAASGTPVTIIFDRSISLGLVESTPLTIPASADITLTSNSELIGSNIEFFSLYGVNGASTITINNGGTLKLAGIIVTHVTGTTGNGVTVNSGGTLLMSGGIISSNSGSGVSSSGSFVMEGGVISGNTVGVYNYGGSFVMEGGVISNNSGNGVSIYGTGTYIGGVYTIVGSFVMEGGVISGNSGSGVSSSGSFVMEGGVISGNTASSGGGVISGGSFVMRGGVISGNTASSGGGGVYNSGSFVMRGGEVSGNAATLVNWSYRGSGGGVYVSGGRFDLYGGTISGNMAAGNGGGVWVTDATSSFDRFRIPEEAVGVVFENNRASVAYDRLLIHDPIYEAYIEGEVTWSAPFTQGYNNYDVSYVPSGVSPRESFAVTVVGSNAPITGAGNYVEKAVVIIDAGDAPEGKEFKRWETDSTDVVFGNVNSAITAFVMPAYPVEVTAVFGEATVVLYSVVVVSEGLNVVVGRYAAGETVNINAGAAPEGFQFANWVTDSEDIVFKDANSVSTSFVMPNHAVEVTAVFEKIKDDAVVVLVGIVAVAVDSKTVYVVGDGLDLSGLVVTALYSDGSSNQVSDYVTNPQNGIVLDTVGLVPVTVSYTENDVTKTTSFTVTVSLQSDLHTVAFDSAGGSEVKPQMVAVGECANEPEAPVREGYVFLGWYLNDVKFDFEEPITQDLTLVAKWEEIIVPTTYTVTYEANGGVGNVPVDSNGPYDFGSVVTILGQGELSCEGYVFRGWSQNPNNHDYVSMPSWTFTIEYNVVYYAVWEETTRQYTVIYDANGGVGNVPVDSNGQYVIGSTVTLLDQGELSCEGYVFRGWSQDSANPSYVSEPNWMFTILGDVVYYAVWEETTRQYTVTYNANGGVGNAPVDSNSPYVIGSAVTLLDQGELSCEGYVFRGWSQNPNNPTYVSEPNWMFTILGDVVYYAVWEEIPQPTETTF